MTFAQFVDNAFLIIGSITIAIILLRSMWFFIGYVFLGGDDAERTHMKNNLLMSSISLMFVMIFWGIFSLIGSAIGL